MKLLKNKVIAMILIVGLIALFTVVIMKMAEQKNPQVKIETTKGDLIVELYPDKAPITVANFLNYVNSGFYDGLVFHRVINGFMIQTGGFTSTGQEKETKDPIKLESNNGLKNEKYTLAMARTSIPDSATSQFFINTANNDFLNYGTRDEGYAVFGKVISGQNIIDQIERAKTGIKFGMQDWPVEEIKIISIKKI